MKTILFSISNTIDMEALLYAQNEAIKEDAKLIVLYITSPLTFSSCYTYPSVLYSVANLNIDNIEVAHEALSQKISSILEDCPHQVICLIGPQIDSILNVAKEYNVEKIILPYESSIIDKLSNKSMKLKLAKKCDIPIDIFGSVLTE
ncbi:hypothetical protein AN639_00210 [Candidatus Epulonipiscium fishelsonii]|uniref:Uncharacterized protein n=1 Tax=Candidatus Epulonipiscium fishelsonii TaxID=77094 RepID=A0ACC8XEI6_9FIRM|nr:hypothetical protein AN396_00600 [Epulopiscium sp. SCG-B11WGA-EpuloA1]ONI43948.1 hypothetical protein AN639_00210 [Epulopiscium sp. SCG-B05WGA-EpuloA1]